MINFNAKKLTVGVQRFGMMDDCPDWMKKGHEHVFKSSNDAENFAHHILDELGNRRVNVRFHTGGYIVTNTGLTYKNAMEIKQRHPDAIITEIHEPPNDKKYGFFYRDSGRVDGCIFNAIHDARIYWESTFPSWEYYLFTNSVAYSNPVTGTVVEICEIPPPPMPNVTFTIGQQEIYSCECGWTGLELSYRKTGRRHRIEATCPKCGSLFGNSVNFIGEL